MGESRDSGQEIFKINAEIRQLEDENQRLAVKPTTEPDMIGEVNPNEDEFKQILENENRIEQLRTRRDELMRGNS